RFSAVLHVVELRRHLWRWLAGVAFVDAGGLWPGWDDISPDGLRPSAGAGLRLRTPLGIVRGDMGVNLDRRENEDRVRFHLSVGQAF
ncbi:MAG: BamA/TamA family outer membrane protein, partial [Candidatus Krumholzibacteriota bacterium]|nr:BamA/TamA family outer membrane protein [Candidatus Krumholzibacteriota bacterium]